MNIEKLDKVIEAIEDRIISLSREHEKPLDGEIKALASLIQARAYLDHLIE